MDETIGLADRCIKKATELAALCIGTLYKQVMHGQVYELQKHKGSLLLFDKQSREYTLASDKINEWARDWNVT